MLTREAGSVEAGYQDSGTEQGGGAASPCGDTERDVSLDLARGFAAGYVSITKESNYETHLWEIARGPVVFIATQTR